jgi:uncharacterized protein YrrD
VETWQLAARLAAAEGYEVYDRDGRKIGHVDHLVCRHHTDRPDFIIIRRRFLLRARVGRVPFEAVADVHDEARFVRLTMPADSIARN